MRQQHFFFVLPLAFAAAFLSLVACDQKPSSSEQPAQTEAREFMSETVSRPTQAPSPQASENPALLNAAAESAAAVTFSSRPSESAESETANSAATSEDAPRELSETTESNTLVSADDPLMSEYKGYQDINKILKVRAFVPGADPFELYRYLGAAGVSLSALLGQWNGFGVQSSFLNGKPNTINLILWHLALSGFAQDLARVCPDATEKPTFKTDSLNPLLLKSLQTLCSWPDASAKNADNLMALWMSLMGFDAPYEEFLAWQEFLHSPEMGQTPAAQALPDAITAIFLNPHFLLKN